MLKQLDGFDNQLTNWYPTRNQLTFVIKQLEEYGDEEGRDFEVRVKDKMVAVFINKVADNTPPIVGLFERKGQSPMYAGYGEKDE